MSTDSSSSSSSSASCLTLNGKQIRVERLDASLQAPSKEQSALLLLSSLLSIPSDILRTPQKAAVYETLFDQRDLYLVALTLWEATSKHEDLEKQPVFFRFGEGGSLDDSMHDAYHQIVTEEDAAKLHAIDSQVDGCIFMSRHIDSHVFVVRVLLGHPVFPILFEYHGLHPSAECISPGAARTIEFPADMTMHVSDSPRYFTELYALHAALLADSKCSAREQPAAKKFWTGARVTYVGGKLGVSSGAKSHFCSFGNIVGAVEVPLKEDQHIPSINLIREEYLTGQAAAVSASGSGGKNRSTSRRKISPPPVPSSSQILASSDYLNTPVTPALFVGFDYPSTAGMDSDSDSGSDDDNDEDWGGLGKKRRKPSDSDDNGRGPSAGGDDDEDGDCREPPAKRPCPAKTRNAIAVIDLTYTSPPPDADEEDLLRSPFVCESPGRDMDVEPVAAPLIGLPVSSASHASEPTITMSQFRQAMEEMKADFERRLSLAKEEMEAKMQQQLAAAPAPAPTPFDEASKKLLQDVSTKLTDALERIEELELNECEGHDPDGYGCEHECDTSDLEKSMDEKFAAAEKANKKLREDFVAFQMQLNDSIRTLENRLETAESAAGGAAAAGGEDEDPPASSAEVAKHSEQLKMMLSQMEKIQATIAILNSQAQSQEMQTLTYNTNLAKFQQTSESQVTRITDMDGRIKAITEALRKLKPLVEGVDRRLKEMHDSGADTTPVTMEIDMPSAPISAPVDSAERQSEPIAAGPASITA